ncbi:Heat shock protein Hsp70 [Niveomyces insectorum RCEF 264]|uniref:Heat shock protein Hsp70 n=1 Tax=Niveomyces insectorum RCEF 264 TaxID=1081102 RepID=A0A167WCS5_9HYPO|nr:Heat shock protein Hsp70 [Niveomyces insectorum RCEF 264]
MAESERDAIVIALDFGTTYSGIAYAYTTAPNDIRIITDWPGFDRKLPKTPSVVKYDKGSQTCKWGYEIDNLVEDKIINLKLLLDPDQSNLWPYDIQVDLQAETKKLPKDVLEVAADYFRAIYNHALEEIKSEGLDQSFLDGFEKRFVLTVPAIWSEKAKHLTQKAAERAGITPVDMITEPEAAALFTLDSMKNRGLKKGDVMTVCDAGGGTVDLISYEVKGVEPFALRTLTVASGGIAGSLLLNKGFEQLVQGAVAGNEAFVALRKSDAYRDAMKDFDFVIKPSFRGPNDVCKYAKFTMAKLEDNPAKGLERDALALPGPTLQKIFDPVITTIDNLVTDQVRRAKAEYQAQASDASSSDENTRTAIFLVGGFGGSHYLKSVIEKSHPGVMVIQPKDGWAAIAKGAILSKLNGRATVLTTRSPKHYGTKVTANWDPVVDKGHPIFYDEWAEEYRCTRMEWYMRKGQELKRDERIRLSFNKTFSDREFQKRELMVWDSLYESSEDDAPRHPPGDEGASCRRNCRLSTDLSLVPTSFFSRRERSSDKAVFWKLAFALEIEINPSGLMKFSLKVGGEEYSAVETKF